MLKLALEAIIVIRRNIKLASAGSKICVMKAWLAGPAARRVKGRYYCGNSRMAAHRHHGEIHAYAALLAAWPAVLTAAEHWR